MTASTPQTLLAEKRVLIVGMGGLGCPAALALAHAGVGELLLCDDDRVELTNLHRQILFSDADVGRDKLDAAQDALEKEGARKVTLLRTRLLPKVARELVREADVVVEGADNFATKFLTADACYLEGRPVVHGAGVRTHGTVFSVSANGAPCYRCLFEDLLPDGTAPNCSSDGVLGPVVGVIGALMADLALDLLLSDPSRSGSIFSFDGKKVSLRSTLITPRKDCPLCGPAAIERIQTLSRALYAPSQPHESPQPPYEPTTTISA